MKALIFGLALGLLPMQCDAGQYVSNARVKQITQQEKRRCPRCTEKELLKRINARIERGW